MVSPTWTPGRPDTWMAEHLEWKPSSGLEQLFVTCCVDLGECPPPEASVSPPFSEEGGLKVIPEALSRILWLHMDLARTGPHGKASPSTRAYVCNPQLHGHHAKETRGPGTPAGKRGVWEHQQPPQAPAPAPSAWLHSIRPGGVTKAYQPWTWLENPGRKGGGEEVRMEGREGGRKQVGMDLRQVLGSG